MKRFFPFLVLGCLTLAACQPSETNTADADQTTAPQAETSASDNTTNFYEIMTPQGRMVLRLYDETSRHRDNFRRLADQGFYDGTTFHRVMEGFMIQGGDPWSKDNNPNNDGLGGPGYTIPGTFHPSIFHKKGVIAAARQPDDINPERESSGSQFYIVQGRVYNNPTLNGIQAQLQRAIPDDDFEFTPEARQAYTTIGGTPSLDMQYTVFGELVEGLDVLDRIAAVQTDRADRPLDNVTMTVKPLYDYTMPQ